MNLLPDEAAALAKEIAEFTSSAKKTQCGIAPTSLSLSTVVSATADSNLWTGAQNVHPKDSGTFTGEISASMARNVGCAFALVGHSERRHVFSETQALCTERSKGVLDQDLKLVYCIGETEAENQTGKTFEVVTEQLLPILKLAKNDTSNLLIAYEPVWAIGTGKVATPEIIADITAQINNLVKEQTGAEAPILYGGSVKPNNYAEIIAIDNVQGALVGGASLQADSFAALLACSEE